MAYTTDPKKLKRINSAHKKNLSTFNNPKYKLGKQIELPGSRFVKRRCSVCGKDKYTNDETYPYMCSSCEEDYL